MLIIVGVVAVILGPPAQRLWMAAKALY